MKLQMIDLRPQLDSIEADRMLIKDAAGYVKNLWSQMNSAELCITAGRELKNLHEHLAKNNQYDKTRIGWKRAFSKTENRFGFTRRKAETYIAVFEAFSQGGNALPPSKLPQSLRALHCLAKLKLSSEQLEKYVADGLIGPNSTESDIRRVTQTKKPKRKRQTIGGVTIPAKTAPKKQRIEAAFELLARLGLTIDDLDKESAP